VVYSLQKDTFGYQIKVVLIFCTLCAVYTWNQHVTWWNIVVLRRLLCSILSGRKLRVPKGFQSSPRFGRVLLLPKLSTLQIFVKYLGLPNGSLSTKTTEKLCLPLFAAFCSCDPQNCFILPFFFCSLVPAKIPAWETLRTLATLPC